ncbi:MAG: hypothetical protein PHE45_06675 [Bacteroidales bacterium]|nr:hypothetical protein [Bacteroidales bacterium]
MRIEFDTPTRSTLSSWMKFRTNSKLARLAQRRALELGARIFESQDITPDPLPEIKAVAATPPATATATAAATATATNYRKKKNNNDTLFNFNA